MMKKWLSNLCRKVSAIGRNIASRIKAKWEKAKFERKIQNIISQVKAGMMKIPWLSNFYSWIKAKWEEFKFEKEIREHLSKNNEAFSRNHWSPADRIIVWSSKHIGRVIATITIAILLIAIVLSPACLLMECELLSKSQQNFLLAIFKAQVTMLGIIFPVIFGFVAIILKDKPYNEPIWEIYQYSSGFIPAIFSFLAFAITFVVCQFWGFITSDGSSVVALNFFLIWFVINLILSGFFFWRTIQFLSSSNRMKMIAKYIINEMPSYIVWINDAKERKNIKIMKQEYDRLDQTQPIDNRHEREIQKAKDSIIEYLESCSLQRNKPTSRPLEIERLFTAIFSEVKATIGDNPKLFKFAKENLIPFYTEIVSSIAFTNEEEQPDNFLLAPAEEGLIAPRSCIEVFIEDTNYISGLVIKEIRNDDIYYKIWCNFYIGLFTNSKMNIPEDIAKSYIKGHYIIWKQLMEYISDSNLNTEKRNNLIDYYLESWGRWGNKLLRTDSNNAQNTLQKDTLGFNCAIYHLEITSYILAKAVEHTNSAAIEKAVNLLTGWLNLFSTATSASSYGYCYGNELLALSCEMITKDTEAPQLVRDKLTEEKLEERISAIALRNYWIDIRWLAAAYLMNTPDCSNSKEYIDNILNGITTTQSHDVIVREQCFIPLLSIDTILIIYLRQIQDEYVGDLDEHYKKFTGEYGKWFSETPVLIHDKEEYLKCLLQFYKVIGVGVATQELGDNITSEWRDFLKSNTIESRGLQETIVDLQKLTEVDDTVIEKVCDQFDISNDEAEKRRDLFKKSINSICDGLT